MIKSRSQRSRRRSPAPSFSKVGVRIASALLPVLVFAGPILADAAAPLSRAAVFGGQLRTAASYEPCSPAWLEQGSFQPGARPALGLVSPDAASGIEQDVSGPLRRGFIVAPPDLGPGNPSAAALPRPQQEADSETRPSSAAPPNDELYWAGQFNSLPVMRALDAWETTYGGDDVTIAVIGDGIDTGHPDLDAKIWQNRHERPNGLDDDGNGYVDDLFGWDFAEGDNDPAPVGPYGTMQAGIAAAETNNRIGVAAINWNARLMPLKVYKTFQLDGSVVVGAYPEDFTRAVCYATNNGARVILFASLNLQGVEQVAPDIERLRVAIENAYERGTLTVAPAGDCALGKRWCPNAEQFGANPPMFPAVFHNVVGVQAFVPGYQRRDTASFGPWVDIAAPGEGFYTTVPSATDEPYYYIRRETLVVSDFAAAQVAGVVAMMMSVNPNYPLGRIQDTLCESAYQNYGGPYDGGRNDQFGCGLLSAERSIEGMPWKMRVSPERVMDLTTGRAPGPSQEFVSPYLNAIRWEIRSQVPWIRTLPVAGRAGGPSVARIVTDVAAMPPGMLQAGMTHTETLHACTVDGVVEDCQEIEYGLRVVERIHRVLLPFSLRTH